MASSRLLFSPAARLALCRGFNQLADTIQVSLGRKDDWWQLVEMIPAGHLTF